MSDADSEPELLLAAASTAALCCICGDRLAASLGPFSRQPLCTEHLGPDLADAHRLLADVGEQLQPYRGADAAASVASEVQTVEQHLAALQLALDAARDSLERCRLKVRQSAEARLAALRTCLLDCEDIQKYDAEVADARAADDLTEACRVALSMQLSVPDLQRDFDAAHRLREAGAGTDSADLRSVQRLQRLAASFAEDTDHVTDAVVMVRPETSQAATWVRDPWAPIVANCRPNPTDDYIMWMAACTDTTGFVGDSAGRVVPAEAAGKDFRPVPQPCLILAFNTCEKKNYLGVTSVDLSVQLQCHCPLNWKQPICGIHCHSRKLFIAQDDGITETDLSGCLVRRICPEIGGIWGVGGNECSLFVSGSNNIVEFSRDKGQAKKRHTQLGQIPDAMLSSIAMSGNCILLRDRQSGQVHQVRTDTHELVASHPVESTGLAHFESPRDVAVDSKGRLFVSEFKANRVSVLDADDGSLLTTLGPAIDGHGRDDKGELLDSPSGLVVVTDGSCERLLVACSPPTMFRSRKLVTFDLH